MAEAFDVCVIGSGAGGGPVALTLAEAGYSVCVLEKGPWYRTKDFTKDEIGVTRRPFLEPDRRRDPHVWDKDIDGRRHAWITDQGWNAVCVGGATTVMSGFFHRLKPEDFRLLSTYGPVPGAAVVDWPISYDDLEPWYDLVERVVGVSGRVVDLPGADRRSSPAFPLPPLKEHPFAARIDETCARLGLHAHPVARAVLSQDRPEDEREACSYTRFCASYGCATGAKGSSLVALLPRAIRTGRCTVVPQAMVRRLVTDDATGRVVAAEWLDGQGAVHRVEARAFAVACNPIESARLLLASPGRRHPAGLANGRGLVGTHLLFSTFAACWGDFPYDREGEWLRSEEPFVHRSVEDYHTIDTPALGRRKGGTLNFLLMHGNPISASVQVAMWNDVPLWGAPLKRALRRYFVETQHLKCEVFGDYTPVAEGRVGLDPTGVRDAWGLPAARVRIVRHPRDRDTVRFLVDRGADVLRALGGENLRVPTDVGGESTNLIAGTCRFGSDPATSVLDRDCRAWDCENLWVTDGSFLPTGGSVPYTMTVYANAFRVGDRMVAALGGRRGG